MMSDEKIDRYLDPVRSKNDIRRFLYNKDLDKTAYLYINRFDLGRFSLDFANNEYSLTDWYILQGILIFRIADAMTIWQYLMLLKSKNEKLLIQTSFDVIRKRLSVLTKRGLLGKSMFIQGTDLSKDTVYETLKKEMIKDLEEEEEDADIEDISYSVMQSKKKKNAAKSTNKITREREVYSESYKEYFGKDALRVSMYFITEEALPKVCSYFGSSPVFPIRHLEVKSLSEKMGIASGAMASVLLFGLKEKVNILNAHVKSKYRDFALLSETEFMGVNKRYFGAVFSSFSYYDPEKESEDFRDNKLKDTVLCVKNYLGIKGINKEGQDAFALILVNDTDDLTRFVAMCKKEKLTDKDLDRMFFTCEGLLKDVFLDLVFQISILGHGYKIIKASLPVR